MPVRLGLCGDELQNAEMEEGESSVRTHNVVGRKRAAAAEAAAGGPGGSAAKQANVDPPPAEAPDRTAL